MTNTVGFSGVPSYPARPPFVADVHGRYRIPALPGRALVTVRVLANADRARFPTNKGQERIAEARSSGMWTKFDTLPSECAATMFHRVREICPKETDQQIVEDFALTPSRTLKLRVLNPQGRPLTGIKMAGANERDFFMLPVPGDEYVVRNYDPTFPRRLILWHKERRLAGTLILEGEQQGPIDVKLQPQGVIIGRLVDDDGTPLSNVVLGVPLLLEPQSPTDISALPQPNDRTNEDGRFRIEGVAPGMKYNVLTQLPNGRYRRVIVDVVAKAGQTTDLGDVKLRPLKFTPN